MEENEKEVIDTPVEETQEEVNEVEETEDVEDSNNTSSEDYREYWEKKVKTLEAQKDHWRKKAEGSKKDTEPLKKSNETQSGLSKDEIILYAKGHTEDEVELAKKLATINGVSPLKAIEDEIFKSKVSSRLKKEKSEQASLPASGYVGKVKSEKPVGKMTLDEHKEYFKKVMGQV